MESEKLYFLFSFFPEFGIKTKQFRGCTTNHSLTVCASKLQKNCESSPVRILKVIRISLTAVRRLLYELPGLKIIHLIRDPRATLTSQARFGMCKISKGGKYGCTNTFCSKLENNELEEESIARMHLGRIKKVFYEDIALNPVDTSKTLFDFIGTTFTKEMEEYIVNITMAGNPDNCNICTTRSNSKLHIDEWRTKIKPSFRSIIEKRCNYVLQRYKYMQTANS